VVGACIDTVNGLHVTEDPMTAIERLAPRAFTNHFRDDRIEFQRWGFKLVGAAVGEGDIDMRRAYEVFRDHSSMERINIETELQTPLDDMQTALDMEIDAIRRSVRYCREELGIRQVGPVMRVRLSGGTQFVYFFQEGCLAKRLDHEGIALVSGLDHIIHVTVRSDHDFPGRCDAVFLFQQTKSVQQVQPGDVRQLNVDGDQVVGLIVINGFYKAFSRHDTAGRRIASPHVGQHQFQFLQCDGFIVNQQNPHGQVPFHWETNSLNR
jgi:hypothetical protein